VSLSGATNLELATDLYDFMASQQADRSFALTQSGAYAVYVSTRVTSVCSDGGCTQSYRHDLRSVPTRGGDSLQLSTTVDWKFALSPTADDVALIEPVWPGDGGNPSYALRVVSAATGSGRTLYVSSYLLWGQRFLPDGRGVLVLENPMNNNAPQEYRLVYAPLQGAPLELARWAFDNYNYHYFVDPHGCIVAHPSPDAMATVFTRIP
jgi:hypothetical protein